MVIGVGVNLQPAAYPPEVRDRATSIEDELGRPVDRERLLAEMLIVAVGPPVAARAKPG